MSFKNYVKTRRVTNTPAGDFIKDARSDSNLRDFESYDDLKSYLETCNAIKEVYPAARSVWRGYQNKIRKNNNLKP